MTTLLSNSLFVSHGAPTVAIEPSSAREFLSRLGGEIGTPRAIVCISAHWMTERPRVTGVERPETIHDFSGFPEELYRMQYRPPGAVAAALEVVDALRKAKFDCEIDPNRGLDHGAWVPLSLMYPTADIPTLQLSVQPHLGAAYHLALGMALASLPERGVLVLGSGSATHNLGQLNYSANASTSPQVTAFVEWLAAAIEDGRFEDVANYRRLAPHAAFNHPTEEHFLPLLVAAGAGGVKATGRCLHSSYTFGNLSMASYAFAHEDKLANVA